MIIHNGGPGLSLEEVVLFPFDDYSIPFQRGVQLDLSSKRGKIVVPLGPEGAVDGKSIIYYGAVCRIGDELWMWYIGSGNVCFATSKDGYNWEKPNLGLVEYNGSTQNNMVDLGGLRVVACVVLHDPDDPDPERRFKMVFETHRRVPSHGGRAEFNTAISPDGLTWTEIPVNPHYLSCEMGGFIKFNGCYYVCAQSGGGHPGPPRKLETFVSYDFENWVEADCMGFYRGNIPPRPVVSGGHAGEQVHLGAGLWDRGNVIVGIYGQWHGHPTNDRRLTSMDLGLVVSNDALHYREPVPDFVLVPGAEDPVAVPKNGWPALMQGQGVENIGDETITWYGSWRNGDGVRAVTWPRDRLGSFKAFKGGKMGSMQESHFVSAPIDLEGKPACIYMNVGGLSEYAQIEVEVLNERFEKLPGFTSEECITPKKSGFRQLVKWQENEAVKNVDGPIRIRVNFGGIRPEDVRIYAIYCASA